MPFPAKSLTFAAFATVSVLAVGTLSTPVHAQNTMKQCADQWNAMKAKNQTGNLTYQQFSKQCMSSGDDAAATTPAKPSTSTAKPSSTTAPKPTQASAKNDDEDTGTAKEDLAKCNDGWKDYKAKNNVSGAKAWHVFMAKCLP